MVNKRAGILIILTLALLSACSSPRESSSGSENWLLEIRQDHPRLFFNADTWPAVKQRALNEEAELYATIKERVDELLDRMLEPRDYGRQAAEAALVFLITEDDKYLELARQLLTASVDFYHQCYQAGKSVSWYSYSRINAWAAYDWIFNYLSEKERKALGASFLKAVQNVQPTKARKPFFHENWSGPVSGFYGTPSLLWYAGLATYKEGIDDELAEEFLTRGYDLYMKVFQYRLRSADDDGGSATAALNYALAAYPWAEFLFFHTFNSATGRNIAKDWPYVAYLPGYIFWNWLPGARNFGWGDSYHTTNRIGLGSLHMHLSQIVHFYGDQMRREVAFAKWLRRKTKRNDRSSFSFTRFLLTKTHPEIEPAGPPEDLPHARHFEHMGQVFFRSGSGPDDTYASFTAGGRLEQHKHFDHNNFVIFKKGFLALDTGTRPEPGIHLSHYYCRTVAHNCILIHMPGEVMPRYWGNRAPGEPDLPYPNDGGQCNQITGSKVVAFETWPEYSYVAGDATEAYHPDKCKLALRQFVFLNPDYFVIFDRVSSTRAEYRKTWLLHTATKPRITAQTFYADQDEGRLFCRTLYPEEATLVPIGGPGKQFWADGRNWPLPEGYRTPDTLQLLGQWRVEVSPVKPREDDFFLHLIQVGDRSLKRMVNARLVKEGDLLGVRFSSGPRDWQVLFGTQGPASGRITIKEHGTVIVERALTAEVQPQKGIFGRSF